MTPLRKKMVEAMHMRGFAVRTHETYLAVVSDLARFHRRCPSTLSRADLEQYFRHLVLERELSAASCRVHLHAIRFLYCAVLGHASFDVAFTLPSKPRRIPELLTKAEVARIVAACANEKHRALLTTCYGCGLRVSEVVALRIADIDSERGQLRVNQGKGAKDRMVLLGAGVLEALRSYWRAYRPASWLFPGRAPEVALAISSAQRAFTDAKRRAAVAKVGGIHSLRHAYATHQLAAGLPVHMLQRLLGHGSIQSTMRYVHWLPSYRDAGAQHCDLVAVLESGR